MELSSQFSTTPAWKKSSAFRTGGCPEASSLFKTGLIQIVTNAQSGAVLGVQPMVTLPPSSSGVSIAHTSSRAGGASPSLMPPVGTTGPIIVAFALSS